MSTDSFMVLPTDVLGTEYMIPAWKANEKDGGSMLGTTCAYNKDTCCRLLLNFILSK